MRRTTWLVLLALLTIPAVWPLTTVALLKTDDGVIHLFRLHGLDDALHQGILYPRLFPSFAFGYGHAVFSYYGPLAYYAAELAHWLGAGYPDALKWAFALGFWGSAFSAYLLARRFVTPPAALLGALVYVYFPYHLVDTYQRGALAEHWAWVFMPLVLWGMTPRKDAPSPAGAVDRVPLLVSALSIAALIVTHSLVALMFMPFAALYFWAVNGYRPLRRRAGRFALILAIGLGLSAFYWLPIALQQRWVQLSAAAEGEGYVSYMAPAQKFVQDVFLFDYARGEGFPDHPLGFLDFLLLLAAVVMAIQAWRRGDRRRVPLSLFIGLSVLAMFLTLDAAQPVWHALYPLLGFLQFPWRFMTVAGLGVAMASALAFAQRPRGALVLVPLVLLSALAGLRVSETTELDGSDLQSMWRYEFRSQHIGTTWTEEYVPWWVTVDTPAIPRASQAAKPASTLHPQDLRLVEAAYTYRRFTIRSDSSLTLRLHQLYFPPWRVLLDGRPLQTYPSTGLGLLTVDVPPSAGGTLEIDYAATGAEQAGIVLALASAAAAVLYIARGRWLLAAALLAMLAGVAWSVARPPTGPPVRSIGAALGDVAQLVASSQGADSYRPGESLRITLTWLALRETNENLQAFVHVLDATTGRLLAQSDGQPVGGYTPTSQWHTGELIEDTRTLQIPADAAVGAYVLVAGLYRLQPLQNLPATWNGQSVPDGQVRLGTLQVLSARP
jgi:hypothetical protein